MRAGAPLAPATFIGATTTCARSGSRSRLLTFSRIIRPAPSQTRCRSNVVESTGSALGPSKPTAEMPRFQRRLRHYVDAVNALCDALLPKVIAVTGGLPVPA